MAALAILVGAGGLTVLEPAVASASPLKVGAVTRHSSRFVGREVAITGFVLAQEAGYVIVSDEPGGKLGHFDLPVAGEGVATLVPNVRYVFSGTLFDHGLDAINGDPVHLELSAPAIPSHS